MTRLGEQSLDALGSRPVWPPPQASALTRKPAPHEEHLGQVKGPEEGWRVVVGPWLEPQPSMSCAVPWARPPHQDGPAPPSGLVIGTARAGAASEKVVTADVAQIGFPMLSARRAETLTSLLGEQEGSQIHWGI